MSRQSVGAQVGSHWPDAVAWHMVRTHSGEVTGLPVRNWQRTAAILAGGGGGNVTRMVAEALDRHRCRAMRALQL